MRPPKKEEDVEEEKEKKDVDSKFKNFLDPMLSIKKHLGREHESSLTLKKHVKPEVSLKRKRSSSPEKKNKKKKDKKKKSKKSKHYESDKSRKKKRKRHHSTSSDSSSSSEEDRKENAELSIVSFSNYECLPVRLVFFHPLPTYSPTFLTVSCFFLF